MSTEETEAGVHRRQIVGHLEYMRDDFSEEIPEKIMRGEGDFKVRGNWYAGVVADAEEAIYLSSKQNYQEEISEMRKLINYFCESDEFAQKLGRLGSRTDVEDMNKGNRLIELALGILK